LEDSLAHTFCPCAYWDEQFCSPAIIELRMIPQTILQRRTHHEFVQAES
jgi:hypothetical protein